MMNTNHLGLGTMGMDFNNRKTSIETIHAALQNGVRVFNTGDFYRGGQSQIVLGEALKGIPREKYFVSLKFGVSFTSQGAFLDVKPENIKGHLFKSLKQMGLDYVDLYQPARQDTEIPVEDIIVEMKKLIDEGYIRHIGLSEVDAETLRRAHKVHPIHSVEVEYSLLNREVENELIQTAKELGVQIVAYGAVGHGILTDKFFSDSANNPMLNRGVLAKEHKDNNLRVLKQMNKLAESKGLSISELAIAWTQSKYDDVLTLIGTTSKQNLESAIHAVNTKLTPNEIDDLERIVSKDTIHGMIMRKWVFTHGKGKMI